MKKILASFLLLIMCISINAQERRQDIKLAFTGDIMMGTDFPSVQLPANEGEFLFQDVTPVLSSATLAFGNLEGTLCDGGSTKKKVGKTCYAFRTPTSFSPRLSDAGYDFLSLANNHANDFGPFGVQSTMQCLDAEGIAYAGIDSLCETAVIEKNGIKYGICAFGHNSYTLRHTDKKTVERILNELTATTDIVIVSFHGGAEGRGHSHLPYTTEYFYGENRGSLREFAHLCIDLGADVVYGHGPHVVRAVELYKDRFVAYSLGNFCTPYGISLTGVSSYAPVITINISEDGKFMGGRIHSFIQERGKGPRKDINNKVAAHIKSLTLSDMKKSPLNIMENGIITIMK